MTEVLKKNLFKKLIAIVFSVIMVVSLIPLSTHAAATSFKDVTDGFEAFYVPVHWAAEKGIVQGYSDRTFRPWNKVTRQQFCVMLWRWNGRPTTSNSVKFTDVTTSMSSYKSIQWAVNKGLIVGYNDGTFRPNDYLTKQQIAVILWRYAGKPNRTTANMQLADVATSASSYRAIQWSMENGLVFSTPNNVGTCTFSPSEHMMRGSMCLALYNYARNVLKQSVSCSKDSRYSNGQIAYYINKQVKVYNTAKQYIYTEYYVPAQLNGKTVILSHGLDGTARGEAAYAAYLAKYGYVVCIYDCRGGVWDGTCRSSGNYNTMSPLTYLADMETVYNATVQRDFVNPKNIIVAGHSQGGLAASLFAGKYPEKIKGLVMLDPAFNIPEVFSKNTSFSTTYRKDAASINITKDTQNYKGNILMICASENPGVNDVVPVYYQNIVYNNYKKCGANVTKYDYAGATHVFSGSYFTRACSDIVSFLSKI